MKPIDIIERLKAEIRKWVPFKNERSKGIQIGLSEAINIIKKSTPQPKYNEDRAREIIDNLATEEPMVDKFGKSLGRTYRVIGQEKFQELFKAISQLSQPSRGIEIDDIKSCFEFHFCSGTPNEKLGKSHYEYGIYSWQLDEDIENIAKLIIQKHKEKDK